MAQKTYSYALFQRAFNITFAAVTLSFASYLLLSIEGFKTMPFIFVPISLLMLSFAKAMKARYMTSKKFILDDTKETLTINNKVYKLKNISNLDITKKRGVEYFTITTTAPNKDTESVVIIGDFITFVEFRNTIIEIAKKHNENVYSLLKKQSVI